MNTADAQRATAIAKQLNLYESSAVVNDILVSMKSILPHHAGYFELEGRLGQMTPLGFVSNVGVKAFSSALALMEAYGGWRRTSDWEEHHDIFFKARVPEELLLLGADQKESDAALRDVRSTVSCSNGRVHVKHVVKRKLRHADFVAKSMLADNATRTLFDIRVTASVETEISSDSLPVAVEPFFVRIKQRKRFFLGSCGVNGDCFSFDFTVVYHGKNKADAEAYQKSGTGASYEIECECMKTLEYIESPQSSCLLLALSLLMKLLDIVIALNPDAHRVVLSPAPDAPKKR